jgi:hypothetical protein
MSVKRNVADQDLAMLVGAWEWWKDSTIGRNVVMSVQMERTNQKGVFVFTCAAIYTEKPNVTRTLCKVVRNYPNSSTDRFPAFFMGIMLDIGRMVDDCLLDKVGETRTPR